MEWKRVLCSRKSMCLLLCLFLLNGAVYWYYLQNGTDDFTMMQEEYEQYVREYPEQMDKIIENGNRLSVFLVFNQEDSFARENIEKTAEDYGRVRDVRPVLLENQGAASLVSFRLARVCVFAFGVWLVFLFLADKKTGLDILLHTCKNGRGRLFVKRFGVLFAAMTACSLLLYAAMFVLLVVKCGFPALYVPVQSLPLMGGVTYPCSMGQFFFWFFLLQTAGIWLPVLVLWLILDRVQNMALGSCVYTLLFAAEYVIRLQTAPQSNLSFLRYANLYFSFDLSELWVTYRNVRLGNRAVSGGGLYVCFLAVSVCLIFCLLLFSAARRYPVRARSVVTKAMERAAAQLRNKLAPLPVFCWELYKILWCQKGILVLFFFVWLMYGTVNPSQMLFTAEQEYRNVFFEENEGPATGERVEKMREDEYLSEYGEYISAKWEEGYTDLWLVNWRGYEVLLNDGKRSGDGVMAGVCILFLVAGSFTYDKKRGMIPLFRSAKKGQGWLLRQKHVAADVLVLAVWGVKLWYEWRRVSIHYPLRCLPAPVQSLPFLSEITLPLSIAACLSFIAFVELLVLFTYKNAILCLSALFSKGYMVLSVGFLCIIPGALSGGMTAAGICSDRAVWLRCAEAAALIIVNIALYQAGSFMWKKTRGGEV